MGREDEILRDTRETKANLAEIQGDLQEIKVLNETQTSHIGTLEQLITDLRGQIPNNDTLNQAADEVAEVKSLSRQIADVIPEPPTPPEEPA